MTHDEELIERVICALNNYCCDERMAELAIDAVRSYDREQRAKIEAAGGLFDLSGNGRHLMPRDPLAEYISHDPDDYRDLPLSMTANVRFKGGLTEGKS